MKKSIGNCHTHFRKHGHGCPRRPPRPHPTPLSISLVKSAFYLSRKTEHCMGQRPCCAALFESAPSEANWILDWNIRKYPAPPLFQGESPDKTESVILYQLFIQPLANEGNPSGAGGGFRCSPFWIFYYIQPRILRWKLIFKHIEN